MGSPKALLPYKGKNFINTLIDVFALCEQTVVVLGYDADRVHAGITSAATIIVNPHPERGQLSSLQCGLTAVPQAEAVFFTPVDYPAISSGTVQQLLPHAGAFAMPQYEGRRGHPVLINRPLIEEILACQTSARDVIRAHTPVYVQVDDPGILEDVDDPAAYVRLTQEVLAP
jgi:molybdenum cofactor cytidylyltransferase